MAIIMSVLKWFVWTSRPCDFNAPTYHVAFSPSFPAGECLTYISGRFMSGKRDGLSLYMNMKEKEK